MKYYVFPGINKFSEDELKDIHLVCNVAFNTNLLWSDFLSLLAKNCNMKTIEWDVIDFLNHDFTMSAIKCYKDIHKCDLRTAKAMVEKIREDMDKFSKKGVM